MTDTLAEHADPTLHAGEPLVEMENVGKSFGPIIALQGVNLTINAGEVACVLGDNGAEMAGGRELAELSHELKGR